MRKKNQFEFAWIHVTIIIGSFSKFLLLEQRITSSPSQSSNGGLKIECAILVTVQQDQYFYWEFELLKLRSFFIALHILLKAWKNLQNLKPKILA